MRKITIVYDRSSYLHKWLQPLFAARKQFLQLGYEINYQGIMDYLPIDLFGLQGGKQEIKSINLAISKKHDIVMLAFHHSTSMLGRMAPDDRAKILKRIREKAKTVIWLDTADSTGTCLFDVMPYVDLYFKKQLLRDRTAYCIPMYGGRSFCDYYYNLLHVEDERITYEQYLPATVDDIKKLRIAWNVGLGDLFAKGIKTIIPNHIVKPSFISPDSPRNLDVQYRGSGYSPIAGYPRSRSKEILSEMAGLLTISDINKRIPKKDFVKEIQNSRCVLSPFGWGEICGRDFEAIAYGACVLKQDMSHCETFPDVYQPMKTYVPLKWDFSDFEEKVLAARSNEYCLIAKNAQNYYKYFYTQKGRMAFAKHIVSEIERN